MVSRRFKRMALIVAVSTFLAVASVPAMANTLSVSGILAWFAGPSMEAGAAEFLRNHPGVELSFVGAGPEEVIVRIIGGSPPDLVGLPPATLAQWAEQDLLQPVTSFIGRDGINPADFIPPAWAGVNYKGEVWALPLIVDPNSTNNSPCFLRTRAV